MREAPRRPPELHLRTYPCVPSQAGAHSWLKEVRFGIPSSGVAPTYRLYYTPFTYHGSPTGLSIMASYSPRADTADPAWLSAHGLTPADLASGAFRARLPAAESSRDGPRD